MSELTLRWWSPTSAEKYLFAGAYTGSLDDVENALEGQLWG